MAVVGSVLFGSMVIVSAYVVGAVVGDVVVPAIARGEVGTGTLALAAAALFGISVLRVVGIFGRRLGAGYMQYRLQAAYRRRVTRRYLDLPLSWHHRNATGTLLSNANSDVEAAWYPIAPLPFAVGTLVMLVGAVVSLFVTDWALALVGLAVFPALFALNVVYSRRMAPRQARAQRLRAEVSGIAHESFDGALVVKTMGREAQETARFAGRAGELRDALIAVGRLRGVFDPLLETLPSLGTLAVLVVGAFRLRQGAISVTELVSVAFLFTVLAFPVRAIGWVLAELPRSVAGWDRVRRVLDATGEMPYGQRALDPATAGPATLTFTDVHFSYPPAEAHQAGAQVLGEVGFTVPAGRTVALVGPTGAGKSTIASLAVRLVDPDAGTRRAGRGGRARADRRVAGRHCRPGRRRCRSSSTTPSGPTSPSTGPASTTRTSGRRCGWPRRTGSSRRCPTGWTPWSASGAPRSPAGSGSGSPWPVRWPAGPACWCSTTRPAPSTRAWRRPSSPGCAPRPVNRECPPRRSWWWRTAGPPSRSPTR